MTALIFIIFLGLSVWLYRRTNPPLALGWKVLLTGLRVIAVIALFLALFEPVLSYKREFERKPRMTILTDRSASMDLVEGGESRSARIDQFLSSDKFKRFENNFDVTSLSFADIVSNDPTKLDHQKTALGEVIKEQAEVEVGQPQESWILLSDGISNSGMTAEAAASGMKTPIYAVGVGEEVTERDIAITELDYNRIAYAGKPTTVKIDVSWQGMEGQQATIEIKGNQKILGTKSLMLGAGNLRDEVEMKFTPEKPGQQTFEINIKPFENELLEENNHRAFSMTILKSKMNVLLVSDQIDWEFAFLNRFLENSESVDLTPVIYKKAGGFLGDPMPTRQEDLNYYDLVILYDIDVNKMKARSGIFKSFLEDKGGGVLVFMGGNYLEGRFPRWIDDFLPFMTRRNNSRMLYLKFNGQPMENYLFHPAVRIADSRKGIRDAWQELPNFEALVPLDSVAPNSEIMVTADLGGQGEGSQPIIGLRRVGKGRVLAVSAAPFWHWAFFGYGFGKDNIEYRRFFDGLVNWLSVRDESDPVRIIPDKNVYTRGEQVGFNAYVYDLGFRPITGATGYVTLIKEDTKDSVVAQLIEAGDGKYRTEFESIASGKYNYRGLIEKDDKKLKEATGQIAVESFSIEEFRRRPDFENLMAVSRETGGQFYKIDQTDSLFTKIDSRKISESVKSEITIWNKFWLLLIFIFTLGIEWFLRKKFQLI